MRKLSLAAALLVGSALTTPGFADGHLRIVEGDPLELTIHRRTHRLEAGDTLTFDAGFPHSYCGEGQALVTLRPEI